MIFSASLGHTLLECPAKAQWAIEHPEAEDASELLDLGAIRHAYLLEGSEAVVRIEAPDWRTKAAREARDAARLEGRLPILAHRWQEVLDWAEAVERQLAAFDPVPLRASGGLAEHSYYWTEAGVECRATPDWVSLDHALICDLKTVGGTAHPGAFSRTLWDKGYDLQAALYRRAVKAAHGMDAEFWFVVTETTPPYALSVVALDPEALAFADRKLEAALTLWRRCVATNEWPGYPTRVCYAELPGYVLTQFEERAYYIHTEEEVTR